VNSGLGVAIIGCGGAGGKIVGHYLATPLCKRVVVQDIAADRARACADRHPGAAWTTDFTAVLSDPLIHVVDVSTPNHLHAEQTTAALAAGKHVLVQKPMAPSVAQCAAMVNAAQRSQRLLGVYMSALEDPVCHDMHSLIRQGCLGRVCSVRYRLAHLNRFSKKTDRENWRASVEKTGGGSFMQLGIHGLHLLQWLLDADVCAVRAFSDNIANEKEVGGDDITHAVVQFGNQALGSIETSYCGEGHSLEIYGTHGHLLRSRGTIDFKLHIPYSGVMLKLDGTGVITDPTHGASRHCNRATVSTPASYNA